MKKLILILLLFISFNLSTTYAQKIQANPTATTLDDADLLIISQSGRTKKATLTQLETWITSWITDLRHYKPILQSSSYHIAGKIAGTYAIANGDSAIISGANTLFPLSMIYIDDADFPAALYDSKLRIRVQLSINDVAPTGNYTFGLYPIARPATSGGAGVNIYTLGTVVSGSNGATFTTPAADGLLSAVSSDFTIPSDGWYVIGMVTTATVAASSMIHVNAQLQIRTN